METRNDLGETRLGKGYPYPNHLKLQVLALLELLELLELLGLMPKAVLFPIP